MVTGPFGGICSLLCGRPTGGANVGDLVNALMGVGLRHRCHSSFRCVATGLDSCGRASVSGRCARLRAAPLATIAHLVVIHACGRMYMRHQHICQSGSDSELLPHADLHGYALGICAEAQPLQSRAQWLRAVGCDRIQPCSIHACAAVPLFDMVWRA